MLKLLDNKCHHNVYKKSRCKQSNNQTIKQSNKQSINQSNKKMKKEGKKKFTMKNAFFLPIIAIKYQKTKKTHLYSNATGAATTTTQYIEKQSGFPSLPINTLITKSRNLVSPHNIAQTQYESLKINPFSCHPT